MDILMSPRSRPPFVAQHPWPEGTFLQGGGDGVVISNKPEGNYRTAFVEASHPLTGFLRGEGATVAEAEDAAWAKAQKYLACTDHEYEPRGYTNGAGFCKHCGRFEINLFTPEQLGLYCAACGVATNWHAEKRETVGEFFTCNKHTPHSDSFMCSCIPCRIKWAEEHPPLSQEEMNDALNNILGPAHEES